MPSFSEIIVQLIDHFADGNKSKFAAMIGTSEANVRNYINGRQPKFEVLSSIAKTFEINYECLLTGKGSILSKTEALKEPEFDEWGKIALVDAKAGAGLPANYHNAHYWKELPHFTLPWKQFQEGVFIGIEVTGESMVPTLYPGDILIAKLLAVPHEITDGDVHIMVTSEGVVAKRLTFDRATHQIKCESDNPDYPAYTQPMDTIEAFYHEEAIIRKKLILPMISQLKRLTDLEKDMDTLKAHFKRLEGND